MIFSFHPGPATLVATSGDSLEWYDMAIGGTLVGTGNTLYIQEVLQDTTFYVQSHTIHGGEEQDGGKPDDSGGGGIPPNAAFSYFDAYEPFTILRVTVYVPQNSPDGNRTIQLVNENNIVLDEKIEYLTTGQHEIELNFDVPAGDNFSLRCAENNLFRNNSEVEYPYPIGDVGSITTSVYGNDYYYYFYNWKIQKQFIDCISVRTPANIFVTVATTELANILSDINLFPNPAKNHTYLHFDAKENAQLLLRIFDATGKEVLTRKEISTLVGTNTVEINTSLLSKGMYNVQLSVDGKSISKKLVIQ